MTKLDPFSLTAVSVEQCANGKPFGIATAFVWKRGAQHYLYNTISLPIGMSSPDAMHGPESSKLLFSLT
jgi:hypothetical protein